MVIAGLIRPIFIFFGKCKIWAAFSNSWRFFAACIFKIKNCKMINTKYIIKKKKFPLLKKFECIHRKYNTQKVKNIYLYLFKC